MMDDDDDDDDSILNYLPTHCLITVCEHTIYGLLNPFKPSFSMVTRTKAQN
jgi:hypothetical protein